MSDKTSTPDPDATTSTDPWWDTTTTSPWDDTTTTEPWWDTTTTNGESTTSIQDDMECMDGFEDWIPGSEKCYYISYNDDDLLSWDDASNACMEMTNWNYNVEYNSLNTQLISINSDTENNELYEQLNDLSVDSVWIGLGWSGKKLYTFQYRVFPIKVEGYIKYKLCLHCCKVLTVGHGIRTLRILPLILIGQRESQTSTQTQILTLLKLNKILTQ